MQIVHTIKDLQLALSLIRQAKQAIALVPTMGNLHPGHLQLVTTAQQHADTVVVSLFVNPTQFGANEDLDKYPRTLQADIEKLEAVHTDILFAPNIADIYPHGSEHSTHVHVPGLTDILCGASRPGHFDGVTTIVAKLFNMTRADVALFGEKDFQQLAVIRRMVDDLNIPINIVSVPIVREPSGLAMSSRNGYLSAQQRQLAAAIHPILLTTQQALIDGFSDIDSLRDNAAKSLNDKGFRVDYVHILQRDHLKPATKKDKELVMLIAAYLGSTRLIDNITISLP
ncbi:MAG: pantoate--beta-alanine ligase [Cycloclasticus sp.]|nr:pantoate--beta-alanine ligase [Cycloclasticus sp.]